MGSHSGLSLLVLVALASPAGAAADCVDDAFEDNDSVGSAAPVSEGVISGLQACELDDDYFSIPLTPGDEIQVDARFVHAEGDIQLALLDPAGSVVAASQSTADEEQVVHTAATGGVFSIRVYLMADAGSSEGNVYELEIAVVAPSVVPALSPLGSACLVLLLAVYGLLRHRTASGADL
jgi:hypothetical protein